LWLYAASTMVALNRSQPQPRPVEPIAACSGCLGQD
jgi:hypothetical protein